MTTQNTTGVMPTFVEVYDTTLRDGTQGAGVSLTLQDKLQIARLLDEFGVAYIEGGYPFSNPKDEAFFDQIRKEPLRHAKVAAFGMTRRKSVKAADDANMQALVGSEAPVITIVGKSWEMQVTDVLRATLDENLDMIAESVAFCVQAGREVVYDAEHFFDGYKANAGYAMKTLAAAVQGGATCLVLCDTNGGSLPQEISRIVADVRDRHDVCVGIHVHNDGGLAVANTLAAVQAGAAHVQGTINGIGERCGNVDLTSVIPNLKVKMGLECSGSEHLQKLTEISRYVYEVANLNPAEHQPFVGHAAFAHKGGMHVHAVQRNTSAYEHIDPEIVGNTRRILVSELSGASNILAKSERLGDLEDKAFVRKVLNRVQDMENEGYQFETSEASFELLVHKLRGSYRHSFDLEHYRVVILRTDGATSQTEAIVKVIVNGKAEHHVAEGDGPVNSLDAALRKALVPYYPCLAEMHLVDFKVRVINSRAGTAAKVRVHVQSADHERSWGTIGVSENIIDASWQALVDALEYKLFLTGQLSAAPAADTGADT